MGNKSIEHHGELVITNLQKLESCTIKFEKSGFLGGIDYSIKGYCKNAKGTDIIKLTGKWNEKLSAEFVAQVPDYKKGQSVELWKWETPNFQGPYRLTKYANSLNHFPPEHKDIILPSDSRRRLDRFYLERGYSDYATDWKKVGEYRQRQDHKIRGHGSGPQGLLSPRGERPTHKQSNENGDSEPTGEKKEGKDKDKHNKQKKLERISDHKDKKGKADRTSFVEEESWLPVWFKEDKDHNGKKIWTFKNTYWKIREEREKIVNEKGNPGELYTDPAIRGSSADFASYHSLWSDLLGKETEADTEKAKEKAEKTKKALKEKTEEK